MKHEESPLTRRTLALASTATLLARASQAQPAGSREIAALAPPAPGERAMHLTVNGASHELRLDLRTTLLDALRDHLGLTGTKKGCDHGQCGACTVLVNGRRFNGCLSLAAAREGDEITTIEGLADGRQLHALQAAFVHNDAFQCGFCTPGQICSAVGMLEEIARGLPSAVTADLAAAPTASREEIRERMSGNICRCAAYPNIVAAILEADKTGGLR